jgi:hypothetical protein
MQGAIPNLRAEFLQERIEFCEQLQEKHDLGYLNP